MQADAHGDDEAHRDEEGQGQDQARRQEDDEDGHGIPEDAHRIHRPKRPADPRVNPNQSHRLPQAKGSGEEGKETGQGKEQESEQMTMRRGFIPIVVCLAGLFIGAAIPALAFASSQPYWRVSAVAAPTDASPGGSGEFILQVTNVGNAPSTAGSPVTVVDHLPAGLVATDAGALEPLSLALEGSGFWGECAISEEKRTVTCTYQAGATIAPSSVFPYKSERFALDGLAPPIGVDVSVAPLASGALTDAASVSGGGAPNTATDSAAIVVPQPGEPAIAPFGVSALRQWSTNFDGAPAVQAASHPFETTTSLRLNTEAAGNDARQAGGVARDVHVELPAGFVGYPDAVPTCPRADFDARNNEANASPECPVDTQVGVALLYTESNLIVQLPVYNLVPPAGAPAQFGVAFAKFVGFLTAGVRLNAKGEYVVSVDARDVQTREVTKVDVSLWGVPADVSHDVLRYPVGRNIVVPGNSIASDVPLRPFLSLPSSCGVPQTLAVSAVSWEDPLQTIVPFTGAAASTDEQNNPVSIEGCSKLDFSPSLELTPESSVTSTPTGLEANVRLPQNEDPNGLSEADLKSAVVTLPPGLTVSPSAANGLQSCTPAQIGIGTVAEREQQPTCPAASKVADLEVTTPLLEHPLQGEVYLAQQETVEGSLLGAYLVVDDPLTGILIKLPGKIELGGQAGVTGLRPGQVRASFANSPQFPFSDLKLNFFGGPHASLVTPQTCGSSSAMTEITGWNGSIVAPASNPVAISSGCAQGFAPAFVASTASNQAGAYSPFALTFSREDQSQRLGLISVTTPPGLLGKLAGIAQCPSADIEAAERRNRPGEGAIEQANPSCPAGSEVGTVTASAGSGPDPTYAAGHEYLAGPYRGAPFSLDAITPAIAGPFDLGVVVLRQGLYINPATAQVTVKSDPIPTVIDGVPLDIHSVSVDIDRPSFIFNPTNCSALAVGAAITSTQGTVASVSSPFKAAGCAKLGFKPVFVVSTQGQGSKADGDGLDAKVTYPNGPQGSYANIKSVKVDLPKQLPARLTTLQKACLAATFETDPASCPAPSVVGTVIARTPTLARPLTGPVILVSHGNEAFPDLEIVLQGEGITLILDGNTQVKKGITSNTFKTIPDAPVSSFELKLAAGPYSVLAVNVPEKRNHNLCGQTLNMPTAITGQNGAVIKEVTKITATGCLKPKKAKKPTAKPKKPTKSTRRGK
jgi:uncharacterized repeat protein (TIGR01451 family)